MRSLASGLALGLLCACKTPGSPLKRALTIPQDADRFELSQAQSTFSAHGIDVRLKEFYTVPGPAFENSVVGEAGYPVVLLEIRRDGKTTEAELGSDDSDSKHLRTESRYRLGDWELRVVSLGANSARLALYRRP